MGLEEAKRTSIYTRSAAHRPPSHMTLMGKVRRSSKCSKRLGNQIPGDLACKTGAVDTARRLHGFSIVSM
jgi:hypothetical protein